MSFLTNLSPDELRALREVAKRVFIQYNPPEFYNDREADKIIEAMGPEVMEKRLRHLIDTKVMKGKTQVGAYGK